MKKCTNCGYPNEDAAIHCRNCGFQIGPEPSRRKKPTRLLEKDLPDETRPLGSAAVRWPALVRVTSEGGDGEVVWLREDKQLVVGRAKGHLRFPEDSYLSEPQASIRLSGGKITIRDCGSRNGTWVRLAGEVALADGLECLIGNTRLKWGVPEVGGQTKTAQHTKKGTEEWMPDAESARLHVEVTTAAARGSGREPTRIPVTHTTTIGREGTGIVLDDPFVSPVHAQVRVDAPPTLVDLGSRNGIYYRVESQVDVDPDIMLRMGGQVFRLALRTR